MRKSVKISLAVIGAIVVPTTAEILYLLSQTPAKELPDDRETDNYSTKINGKNFEDLYLFLTKEKDVPSFTDDEVYEMILNQSRYMHKRFDCSDFRAQLLFKIYKDCYHALTPKIRELIKNTFLDFKYFMDEPGSDSMCYWSENHQILFAVSEYLAGQQWPDEVFRNNKMTGKEHMVKAKIRIDAWMKQRFMYGFSEYLSNNYIAEDLSAMANFIVYAQDKKAVEQMKIILDILLLDVALNSINNRFVSTSSRIYGNNKSGNLYGNSIQCAMNVLWGNDAHTKAVKDPYLTEKEKAKLQLSLNKKPNHIILCFTDAVKKGLYILPEAIKDIALYDGTFVSKMSCGLSPEDMETENLIGNEPHQIMAQLGAETFTNHQVIENTLKYLKDNKMFRNSFLSYFIFLNITAFRCISWKKFAKKHNIMPHGIATGRGNVYTYRTNRYCLSTSVCKDVDMCGAQEHVWSANIGETLAAFTTHPAGNGNGHYGSSPGYWIGNGRRPMSIQHKNVNITIYKLPDRIRLGETSVADITHAYMPKEHYDEFELNNNTVFARKNGVYIAMISNGELKYKSFNSSSAAALHKSKDLPDEFKLKSEFDLCRCGGDYHIYVTEISDAETESFEEFKVRIKNNNIKFIKECVLYTTDSDQIKVSYDGIFTVNGIPAEKTYKRYDNKFCNCERKSDALLIDSGKHRLFLDFENVKRNEY